MRHRVASLAPHGRFLAETTRPFSSRVVACDMPLMPGVVGEQASPDPEEARYANYFKVGHNLHEFLFDFGQFHFGDSPEPADSSRVPIVRIVMAPSFAKSFVQTLGRAIDQYEQAHGQIDV